MPKMPGFKKTVERKPFEQPRSFRAPEYDTAEWRNLRKFRLMRDPICHDCKRAMATVLDHITPVRLGGEFWNEANHQPLCAKCHNKKSGKERYLSKSGK